MAHKNKNQYRLLSCISSSADEKRIVFNFESGNSFEWSIIDQNFYHSDTQKEFAKIHFRNIVWGEGIKPGKLGFFSALKRLAKEGWVKNFFFILSEWVERKIQIQERNGTSWVRYGNGVNKLETMTEKESVFNIESLAKNNYINQMNLNKVVDDAFVLGKIRSFKEIKDDGLDNWFFSRAGLRPNARYLRSQYREWENNDIYADPDRQYVLGNYVNSYRVMNKKGMGDVFRYVWETYNYCFNFSNYDFHYFQENFEFLIKNGYEYKRLMDYVFHDMEEQGISNSMVHGRVDLSILCDYVRMSCEVNNNFDKYPKYLKTAHDIATKNYRVKQSNALVKRYEGIVAKLKSKEYEGKEYCVIVPDTLDSIVREGSSLNHCVASYIDNVVEEKTIILFLRSTEDKEKSLVTIEVKEDNVYQARGQSNRSVTKEEQEFIDQYQEWLKNKVSQKNLEMEMV